ncbi:DUF4255 domain-containing protein [Micromonospora sp. NPDC049460]|uniref:DUF4255 domain-containing protein n=1 Tax=unclassified Micromonospora TaxID=2617518 RepID=UPI00372384DA
MSNGLAIAAVTSTLRYVLDRALQRPHPGPVGGARVTTLRPDRLGSSALVQPKGINLFLYQVTPNPAGAVANLPTRRPDGSLHRRPVSAVNLHYLVTCHGEDPSLDGQRLLGTAVTALSLTPVLTREVIRAAVDAYHGADETAFLVDTDLADQIEPVKVSPAPLSVEEMARLWSVFPQTPYQLSVAYQATVVLLEAVATPRTALPVDRRTVSLSAGGSPRLVTVAPEVPGSAVTTGSGIVLYGVRLLGPTTRVRIGPARLAPADDATPSTLRVVLDRTVPAGRHAVRVLHLSRPDASGEPSRVVASSNAGPVTVVPVVRNVTVGAERITLAVDPPLVAGQRATVLLSRVAGAPAPAPDAVSVALPPVAADAAPAARLDVPRRDVPDGQWLVRVRVDDVESLPERVDGVYRAPSITLPVP